MRETEEAAVAEQQIRTIFVSSAQERASVRASLAGAGVRIHISDTVLRRALVQQARRRARASA